MIRKQVGMFLPVALVLSLVIRRSIGLSYFVSYRQGFQ